MGLFPQLYLYSVYTNYKLSLIPFICICAVAPPLKKVLYFQRRLAFVALYSYYFTALSDILERKISTLNIFLSHVFKTCRKLATKCWRINYKKVSFNLTTNHCSLLIQKTPHPNKKGPQETLYNPVLTCITCVRNI